MEIKEFNFKSDKKDCENEDKESDKSKLTAFQKSHGSKETKTVIIIIIIITQRLIVSKTKTTHYRLEALYLPLPS